jgi:hypothetical protein
MRDINTMGMGQEAAVTSNKQINAKLGMIDYFDVTCVDPEGNLKWEERIHNLVTNEGLSHVIQVIFTGQDSAISNWYVGLKDTGAPAATDDAATLGASPQAWTEYTEYDEATRQALTLANESGQSTNNSASVAAFTIGSPAPDVYGVFVVDNNTKGGQSPATVLYGVGDFSSAKVVDPNDTLNVTVTLSAASA